MKAVIATIGNAFAERSYTEGLSDSQNAVAGALDRALMEFGFALLADDVGLGKTRTALSVALRRSQSDRKLGKTGSVLICVPSRVRHQWDRELLAFHELRGRVQFVTHAALSRDAVVNVRACVVIVDEAHQFKNPNAKRTRRLSAIIAATPSIFLTATPIANRPIDLVNLFALGIDDDTLSTAFATDFSTLRNDVLARRFLTLMAILAATTVRRLNSRIQLKFETWSYPASVSERELWRTLDQRIRGLDFPPEETWPIALMIRLMHELLFADTRLAEAKISDLLRFYERLRECNQMGKTFDRRVYRRLFGASPQELLRFMLPDNQTEPWHCETLLKQLQVLVAAFQKIDVSKKYDVLYERISTFDRVIIFSRFSELAGLVFRELRARTVDQIAVITGDQCFISGIGRTSMEHTLERYRSADPRERVRVLVASDCLAEGVDIPGADAVVYLDTPMSPRVFRQRVGRAMRPGAPDTVVVAALHPDPYIETIGLVSNLTNKLADAAEAGIQDEDAFPLNRFSSFSDPSIETKTGHFLVQDDRRITIGFGYLSDDSRRVPILLGCIDGKQVVVGSLIDWLDSVEYGTSTSACSPTIEALFRDETLRRNSFRLAPIQTRSNDPQVNAWRALGEPEVHRNRILGRLNAYERRMFDELLGDSAALLRFIETIPDRSNALMRYEILTSFTTTAEAKHERSKPQTESE